MLEIRAFARAEPFLAAALAFLEAADAENNLLTSAAIASDPRGEAHGRRWLIGERDGQTSSAALVMPGGRIVLASAGPADGQEMGAKLALEWKKERGSRAQWLALGPEPVARAFAEGWLNRPPPPPLLTQTIMRRSTALASEPSGGGRLRPARPGDGAYLRAWMRAFDAETGAIPSQPPAEAWVRPAIERGDAFVWEDERGQPAATASVGGRTRLCGRIHLVYVPPELRRRQFASACVRALALRLRAEGLRDATLFVDPKAERAVALYRGLGFARVADFVELPLLFRL